MSESFKPHVEDAEQQKEIAITDVPYHKAAKEAIMAWNGASEEEATAAIESQSYDQLENQCWATGSMESGLKGMLKYLQEQGVDVSDINPDDLHADVFGPAEATESVAQTGALAALGEKIKGLEAPEALVVDTLSTIHDDWTRSPGNAKKFFARDKKYQHMPIELIGWKEAKSDLLFLKPILEGAGVEVSDDELQISYYERVAAFQKEHGTETPDGLTAAIQKGADFYSALEGQTEITDFMATPEGAATVAQQIAEKGIGSDLGYQAYLEVQAEQGAE